MLLLRKKESRWPKKLISIWQSKHIKAFGKPPVVSKSYNSASACLLVCTGPGITYSQNLIYLIYAMPAKITEKSQ